MTQQQQFEITIDQLHFGFYKANDLQGKLFDLEYYSLNSNTKKYLWSRIHAATNFGVHVLEK